MAFIGDQVTAIFSIMVHPLQYTSDFSKVVVWLVYLHFQTAKSFVRLFEKISSLPIMIFITLIFLFQNILVVVVVVVVVVVE